MAQGVSGAYLGTFFHTPVYGQMEYLKDALIEVDKDGVITRVALPADADYAQLVAGYRQAGTLTELPAGCVGLPGFVDIHVHSCQWPQSALALDEPRAVRQMHEESLAMGIDESEIDVSDDPQDGGTERIKDPDVRRSVAYLLGGVFFYYMAYNAMTTNISRYAGDFFAMQGGQYAIINIATIAGGLLSYVPMARLSMRVGRKRVALGSGIVMTLGCLVMWAFPSFSPAYYAIFLLMGAGLGAYDLCVYPMILEGCSEKTVGRYSGYYYTVSMAAQVVTPIASGALMDVAEGQLFLYVAAMSAAMVAVTALAKHGDSLTTAQILERERSVGE